MADLRKEDQDPTKFTQGNVPVCSDVNKDHLLCPEVKVDYLNDVYEVNDRFIALVSHDTLPLARDTNNVSINGSVCDTQFTFLVDTGANVTAIKADIWRQIPAPTKHPTSQTTISHIKSVSGESIAVLGQVKVPPHFHFRNHIFCSILNNNVVAPFLIWLNFLTWLLLFYWHFFTPHTVLVFIAASRLRNTEPTSNFHGVFDSIRSYTLVCAQLLCSCLHVFPYVQWLTHFETIRFIYGTINTISHLLSNFSPFL